MDFIDREIQSLYECRLYQFWIRGSCSSIWIVVVETVEGFES